MTSSNGKGYCLPSNRAQGLANYPHARLTPTTSQTLYVSGISSRRGDGSFAGCTEDADNKGSFKLDAAEQTREILQNIRNVIEGATNGKCGLESIVDATIFLTDMGDYAAVNSVWNDIWPDRCDAPARTCLAVVALPNERICVEIKCTAIVNVVARGR